MRTDNDAAVLYDAKGAIDHAAATGHRPVEVHGPGYSPTFECPCANRRVDAWLCACGADMDGGLFCRACGDARPVPPGEVTR